MLALPADEERMPANQILDEHLFNIVALFPWLSYIANYLVAKRFPPSLSCKEMRKIKLEKMPVSPRLEEIDLG